MTDQYNNENIAYNLIVEFPDQSQPFVHGFEAGQIWERLKTTPSILEEMVHVDNTDLLKQIAGHYGYTYSFEVVDETWMKAVLEKGKPKLSLVTP